MEVEISHYKSNLKWNFIDYEHSSGESFSFEIMCSNNSTIYFKHLILIGFFIAYIHNPNVKKMYFNVAVPFYMKAICDSLNIEITPIDYSKHSENMCVDIETEAKNDNSILDIKLQEHLMKCPLNSVAVNSSSACPSDLIFSELLLEHFSSLNNISKIWFLKFRNVSENEYYESFEKSFYFSDKFNENEKVSSLVIFYKFQNLSLNKALHIEQNPFFAIIPSILYAKYCNFKFITLNTTSSQISSFPLFQHIIDISKMIDSSKKLTLLIPFKNESLPKCIHKWYLKLLHETKTNFTETCLKKDNFYKELYKMVCYDFSSSTPNMNIVLNKDLSSNCKCLNCFQYWCLVRKYIFKENINSSFTSKFITNLKKNHPYAFQINTVQYQCFWKTFWKLIQV